MLRVAQVLACFSTALIQSATLEIFARDVVVRSPDQRIRITLRVSNDRVTYKVDRDGQPVVAPSALAVQLAGIGAVATGVNIDTVTQRTIDESSDLIWGKTRRIRDHCHLAIVRLKSNADLEWDIELRAYDDGVALRYGFPRQEKLSELAIEGEATEFRLARDPSILFMPLAGFTTSHEALYERKPLSQLPKDQLLAVPLLAVWEDGRAAAITEARLRSFAGMYLERPAGARTDVLRSRLSPLPDKPDAVVVARTPQWSPWRVVLLADRAGELIESNVLLVLNEPPEGDFKWLKPGKTTFPWWNGTIEHGPPSTPEHNFAVNKAYIDFCARHNIAYHAICSVAGNRPWYVQLDPGFAQPQADTDILQPRPDIDLPRILEYARQKGVGIRLWVNWKPLKDKLDEAFAAYERWGVKGLMIDFMDRDDQQMVEWQERALRAAAKHKLHVQFHGSYKPSGEQHTYPNLFNREGVLNLEYLKWSDSCAPPHNVNVAYTRLLAGPVDYHLGGFRAAARDKFQPRDLLPLVLGTRCHHLALYIVYENPLPMLADVPEAYEGQPGFDFLVDVPTTWDETRFVAGEVGEYVVVARRSGDNWYVGGITNWTRRDLSLPLDFLSDGQFEGSLYGDSSLDGRKPNELRRETRQLSAKTTLDIRLASGGGFVAIMRPVAKP
jgi:alpha-glucosidase